MLFIGIALAIAIGLGVLISGQAGALLGLTPMQTGQLVLFVLLLIFLAGTFFMRPRRFAELVGGLVVWAGIFAVAILGYSYRAEIAGLGGRIFSELAPGVAVVDTERGTATFRRSFNGHFEVRAAVNGHSVPMIFDTGASAVVLTNADARAAGVDMDTLRFNVPVSTANGTGMAARAVLSRIEVGGIVRRNIRAFVSAEDALETSLLGMTFLETLSRYAVSANALELTD